MTFGEKLHEIRLKNGMTQEEVANLVSIQKMTISKYEADKMLPSSRTLLALCKVFSVDPNFFFTERSVKITGQPVFRSRGKEIDISAGTSDLVRSLANDRLDPYVEILAINDVDKEYKKNQELRRVVTRATLEDCAEAVRKAWGLGNMPVDNLTYLLETHGFRVFNIADKFSSEALKDCDAASFLNEECGPVVVVCPGGSRHRQRFSLAHELGHYFILNTESDGKLWNAESRANKFAAAFLMPADAVRYLTGGIAREISGNLLCFLSGHFGVSIQAVIYRLYDLGLISDALKRINLEKDRHHEFDSLKGAHSSGHAPDNVLEVSGYMPFLVERSVVYRLISRDKGEELLFGLGVETDKGDGGGFSLSEMPTAGRRRF